MGREAQPTFDRIREIPTGGHAANRPSPTFPKLRVRPDGTLVISPLVDFSRAASCDARPAPRGPSIGTHGAAIPAVGAGPGPYNESDPAAGGDEQHPPCATSPLNPEAALTGGGGGHFRPDPLVLIGAACALFWLVVWVVVLG